VGKWKYMQDGNVEMLFDLASDIGERRDLAFQEPEVFSQLKKSLATWESELAKEETSFLVK
jgi:hypothetical protein